MNDSNMFSGFQWDILDIAGSVRRSTDPSISISTSANSIDVNLSAYRLLELSDNSIFATVLKSHDGDYLAIRFVNSPSSSSFRVTHPLHKGKPVVGCRITSKALIVKLFGSEPDFSRRRYLAYKVDNNTLAIDLSEPISQR